MTTHLSQFTSACFGALEAFYHLCLVVRFVNLPLEEVSQNTTRLFDDLESEMYHYILRCEMYTWSLANAAVGIRSNQREYLDSAREHVRIMLDYTHLATRKLIERHIAKKLGNDKVAFSDDQAKDAYKQFWNLLNERFDFVRDVCEDEPK